MDGEDAQQLIARLVAERVVELLEAVEVEQQQRARHGRLGLKRARERCRERSPVRQARELVGECLMARLAKLALLAHRVRKPQHRDDDRGGRERARDAV